MTNKEKAIELKDTIYQLYSKEGRSISYIASLLRINRKVLSTSIQEWGFEKDRSKRHLTPSNQKFLNKNRQLIKARLDKNVTISNIAEELGVPCDYLKRTIINNDAVLLKAKEDYLKRVTLLAKSRRDNTLQNSALNYVSEFPLDEEWRKILGYSNYEVSNFGRVRRLAKRYGAYYLLTPSTNIKSGRPYVTLVGDDGKQRGLQLSRLVAFAFVDGYSDVAKTVNHKDGNVTNCSADNLEWVSQSDNNKHAYDVLGRVVNRHKTNYNILYKGTYEFKTVAAFSRFLGKSETQVRRYLEEPEKHDIKLR